MEEIKESDMKESQAYDILLSYFDNNLENMNDFEFSTSETLINTINTIDETNKKKVIVVPPKNTFINRKLNSFFTKPQKKY